jgi:uncharacterized protein (DUF2141 family)
VISRRRTGGRTCALVALFVSLGAAAPVASLEIGIDGTRSPKGSLKLCLTADPDNFPRCHDDALAVRRSVPASTRTFRFDALPQGTYAAAVIHDENDNRKLDTVAGIPKEGYGFSRNAPVMFGPPKFVAARFPLSGDANAQHIRMRYIF